MNLLRTYLKRLSIAGLSAFGAAAMAQDVPFPKRGPVEITVLFPAGTSADITARMLAQGMVKPLGANVIAVNRPGAGGAIGYKYAASQKPDGYSLVWNSNSISTSYHSGQLPFDYRSFDPVARVLLESVVVAVRSDAKWKTLKALIADARAHPEEVTVANSGVGSHTHISSVALFRTANVKVTDVPYAAAQIVPNVVGGHVIAAVQFPAALAASVQSGRLRLLATLTAQRDPAFPDVPTARELGLDIALDAWRGIAVPKGTPQGVVDALEKAIREAVENPEFTAAARKLYARSGFLPAAQFGKLIASEDAYLARIMEQVGLKKSP